MRTEWLQFMGLEPHYQIEEPFGTFLSLIWTAPASHSTEVLVCIDQLDFYLILEDSKSGLLIRHVKNDMLKRLFYFFW